MGRARRPPRCRSSPLTTEFLVEARSGGTCVVRVTASAFGTGADWEDEFIDEMATYYRPFFDLLRLYVERFPGQHATRREVRVDSPTASTPSDVVPAAARSLGVSAPGEQVDGAGGLGLSGTVLRLGRPYLMVEADGPVRGYVSLFGQCRDDGGRVDRAGRLAVRPRRRGVRRQGRGRLADVARRPGSMSPTGTAGPVSLAVSGPTAATRRRTDHDHHRRRRRGPAPYAIETHGLVKHFGETKAVDGVDLRVRAGTVYGVLGPNGAGKTTTIRMLATLIEPTAGTARVLGHDVVAEADAVRGSVSLTGQFASVDEELTGRENLVLLGRLLGFAKRAGRRARDRAARGVRPGRGRRPARVHLLGRHAPAPRHRRQHRRHPRPAVPRRADHRPRPPQPQPGVGHRAGAGRHRHHGAADHAVPRGGRPARRPHRHHRPRPHHRRGHLGRAEGVGRVRRPAGPGGRPRPPSRGRRACWPRRSRAPVDLEADPGGAVGPRRRPRAGPGRADRAGRRGRSSSASSPSPRPASTRCSWR